MLYSFLFVNNYFIFYFFVIACFKLILINKIQNTKNIQDFVINYILISLGIRFSLNLWLEKWCNIIRKAN